MKKLISFLLIMTSLNLFSQEHKMIHLWPGAVPGEMKPKAGPATDTLRKDDVLRYSEVTDPVLEVWLPEAGVKNDAAVVICPGGGYRILAYDKEGTEIAAWFNKLGYTAFILQYRIPNKKDGALQDVQRAIRIVRDNSSKWGIDPGKIGVLGFSAGGSLSARASCLFDKQTYAPVDKADEISCRPDFTMLIYPAYLDEGPGHSVTAELDLSSDVPPVFIFQTADDTYGNSALVMAGALRDAGHEVELHYLPRGGHGYGLRPGTRAGASWPVLTENWLDILLWGKK